MGMARQSTGQAASQAVPVLLTRPEAQARAFAADLATHFGNRLRPVIAPMMAVQQLTPTLPSGPFSGVIFTSSAGVEAAVHLPDPLPRLAWCVGRATARQAERAGFQAHDGGGDADALVAAILADPPPGALLHLRGEDTRGNVAERLNSAGLETVSIVVYRQMAQPLTGEAMALLRQPGPVILPLFSPRSAELMAKAAPSVLADLHLVAMSTAVADAALAIAHRSLHIAARPEAAAMLDGVGLALTKATAP